MHVNFFVYQKVQNFQVQSTIRVQIGEHLLQIRTEFYKIDNFIFYQWAVKINL